METIKNILVTGGGAPGAPGILKAILESNTDITLFSCDIREHTAGKLLAHQYFTVPAGDSPEYIDSFLQKCIEHKIDIVLPITTRELIPLARNKALFVKNNIRIIVSNEQSLAIANNKGKLYNHLKNNQIPTPKFSIATTYKEYKNASSAYLASNEKFIIKPCVANGSRGFRIVTADVEESDLLFNYKPNSTYIKPEKLNDILQSDPFPPLLVSEYMPGTEYTIDCLIVEGETKLIVPRLRKTMNNGISVAGTIEQNTEIIKYCEAILNSLDLDGPIGIQVKYDVAGKPLLLEINPRIQGTTVALCGAGLNMAAMAVQPNMVSEIKNINDYPIRWGTKFIRHYTELYY
jgi:carbamoyl-phosphate synthase large subunit